MFWIESRWREPPSAPAWHEGMLPAEGRSPACY